MKYKYFHIIILIVILISNSLLAQFSNVEVTFDDRLLRNGDRQELLPLINEIEQFFEDTEWDDEYGDLQIPLHVQIIFDGTSEKGSEKIYLAQALFSNGIDQRYFDKSFNFSQKELGSLYYDPVIFQPLSSFLAFYANLILAGEVDTYEIEGGNKFYEVARSIALRASTSDYIRGWTERSRIENILSGNKGLRKTKLALYTAVEHFDYQEYKEAAINFKIMIEGLDEVHEKSPRDHYTALFMDGHAEELAEILGYLEQHELLKDLIELDPDNRDIYEAPLK